MNKCNSPKAKAQPVLKPLLINPKKNFLLKRAEKLAEVTQEGVLKVLYRLDNGVLAMHRSSPNPLLGESLAKVDPCEAQLTFNIRL